jgi:D-sedoheptulose 7-phosphate isomerase
MDAVSLCANPAVITAIANDHGYDQVYCRQLYGMGVGGDVLVALTTSGLSTNVQYAVRAAKNQGMRSVVLTGQRPADRMEWLDDALRDCDVLLRAPCERTARIQEQHLEWLHVMAKAIEEQCCEADGKNRTLCSW